MKKILILLFAITLTAVSFDGTAQCKKKCASSKACNGAKQSKITKADVTVYYFHNERRCATCTAVEDVTVKALKANYADQMKDGKMVFHSINIEDAASAALVKEMKVTGQSLLIIKGDKKVDLTNDAFMYAKTKPEKLEAKIKKNLDKLV